MAGPPRRGRAQRASGAERPVNNGVSTEELMGHVLIVRFGELPQALLAGSGSGGRGGPRAEAARVIRERRKGAGAQTIGDRLSELKEKVTTRPERGPRGVAAHGRSNHHGAWSIPLPRRARSSRPRPGADPSETLSAFVERRLDIPMPVLAVAWASLVAYELVAPARGGRGFVATANCESPSGQPSNPKGPGQRAGAVLREALLQA